MIATDPDRSTYARHVRTTRIWNGVWLALAAFLIWRTGVRERGVISDHLEFGRRVLAGLDLYAPYLEDKPLHAPYPPSFGLLTGPFSLLPERLARFAWGFLQVAAIFVIARRLRDLAREFIPEVLPRLHLLYAIAAVLGARYILRDTHGGGGNLINLALVLSALHLARHRREFLAGAILGFSLATKPVAVLILPLLWILGYRRALSVAIAAAVGYVLLSLLLLRQGVSPFLSWFDGSVRYAGMTNLFDTPAHGFPPFSWMNQCLRCAVARLFGETPAELAALVPGFRQGFGLSAITTTWITRCLSLALIGATFACIWRAHGRAGGSGDRAKPWYIAAVFSLSLLLSPISWKAHHVALLPAFFLLGALALRGRTWAWVTAIAYFLVCGLGEQLVGKGFKEFQQAHYFTTLGTLGLLAVCIWQVHTAERCSPSPLPIAPSRR